MESNTRNRENLKWPTRPDLSVFFNVRTDKMCKKWRLPNRTVPVESHWLLRAIDQGEILILEADPGSDHYFHPSRPSPLFTILQRISNNFFVKVVIANGGTRGLAEWIIDDNCLVDPPGHDRICDHYFPSWSPSIRPCIIKTKNNRPGGSS